MVVWGLLAALAAGITYRFSFLYIVLLAASLLAFAWRHFRLRACAVFLFLPLLFLYGQRTAHVLRLEEQFTRDFFARKQAAGKCAIEGWVSSFPQIGGGRTSFLFQTSAGERDIRLLVYVSSAGIGYGDSLLLQGRLLESRAKIRDGNSTVDPFLFSMGAVAAFRAGRYGVSVLPGCGGPVLQRRVLWPLHNRMRAEILRRLGGRSGIPLALLLGERGELDSRVRRSFVELGISHLLALSGMHLGLIAAAILLIMRRLRIRNLVPLLVVLAVYLGTVGRVLSLYRAFGMAALLVLAKMIHRPMNPLRALGTAALLLLLGSPCILFSVGFQLSFTATFAILLCVASIPAWKTKHAAARPVNYVAATIYVGVIVQVFLAPLLIHHFDRFSVVSPVATLVFFPFVFVVLFLSILCALGAILCPVLGDGLAAVLSPVSGTFTHMLLLAQSLSPSLVHLPPAQPLAYCAGFTIIWLSKRRKWKIFAGAILIVASFLQPLL